MTKDKPSAKIETVQLEDFVAESLSQIVKGVTAAQKNIRNTGALINPVGSYVFKDNRGQQIDLNYKPTPQTIEFDVAVTATSGDKAKAGIGVFIGGVGLGLQGESDIINSTVSRIKFSIPVYLPQAFDEHVENDPKQTPRSEHPLKGVF